MAVDKPEHLSPRPEPDLLSHPGKSHPGPALAPRVEIDELLEGQERLGDADDDPAHIELTKAGQARPRAVAERLDHDPVIAWRGQSREGPACIRDLEAVQVTSDEESP